MDTRPIGIFDTGVGGLTVVSEALRMMPDEEIIYFGDTARVPYGSKSVETVTKFSRQMVRFLISKNVKAIIIACGTISSNSYHVLAKEFDLPFIDVITPGVDACLRATRNNVIGVIGTERTIGSGLHRRLLMERCPEVKVYAKACPLFAPLAEDGWTHNTVARITAEIYLQELLEHDIDTLLLSCTHYPLLQSCIQQAVGNIQVINPSRDVALKMKQHLEDNCLEAPSRGEGGTSKHTFYVSDNTQKFDKICNLTLNRKFEAVKVDIEMY